MKKNNIIKKVTSIICVLTIVLMTLPIGNYVSAFSSVYLGISAPSNYNPNAGGSISFTLSYTGDVASIMIGTGSVVLNGFTANKSITGTGNTRTLTLTNLQGSGSGKSVSITGGTAMASNGSLSNAVTSGTFTINSITPSDTTAPVLAITGPNPNSIKVGQTVTFTAKYTDNVGIASIMLGTGSIVLNGFTANKSITVSGNDRIITLTNIQGSIGGSKTISITGGTAMDAAGNLSNAATSSAFTITETVVTTDTTPPVLAITGPNPSSIHTGETVTYTAVYTDDIGIANISLGTGSIVLNGFTANKSITGTGNSRTITLTNVQGSVGSKSISITGGTAIDAAGNLCNVATSSAFNIIQLSVNTDTTPPTLNITGPNPNSIYTGQTVTYTAVYTDDIGIANISLGSGSIILNGFTANKSITGTGNSRTITLTNVQGSVGSKSISITGGTAIDAAGNLCNAATSSAFNIIQLSVNTDTIPPVLKITGPNFSSIYAGENIIYKAVYTDDIGIANILLTSGSIVLNGFTADISVSGTGNTRIITLTNVQGPLGGLKNISIRAGTAIDAAGNLCNAAISASFSIVEKTVEQAPPDAPKDWIPNPNTGK